MIVCKLNSWSYYYYSYYDIQYIPLLLIHLPLLLLIIRSLALVS